MLTAITNQPIKKLKTKQPMYFIDMITLVRTGVEVDFIYNGNDECQTFLITYQELIKLASEDQRMIMPWVMENIYDVAEQYLAAHQIGQIPKMKMQA